MSVPILACLVGVQSAHVAIGTSAVTVGSSAMLNLILRSRAGNVNWRVALIFACAGVVGVLSGNWTGLMVDARKLMLLFSLLMIEICIFMLIHSRARGDGRGHERRTRTAGSRRRSAHPLRTGRRERLVLAHERHYRATA